MSNIASSTIGTSANLQEGDHISTLEALHGLMLPSGNDAAMALAEHFGARAVKHAVVCGELDPGSTDGWTLRSPEKKRKVGKKHGVSKRSALKELSSNVPRHPSLSPAQSPHCRSPARTPGVLREHVEKDAVTLFVLAMNARVRALQMRHTQFATPHGMAHSKFWSSAGDAAIVSALVMRCDVSSLVMPVLYWIFCVCLSYLLASFLTASVYCRWRTLQSNQLSSGASLPLGSSPHRFSTL